MGWYRFIKWCLINISVYNGFSTTSKFGFSFTFQLIVWENIVNFFRQKQYMGLLWLNKQWKYFELKYKLFCCSPIGEKIIVKQDYWSLKSLLLYNPQYFMNPVHIWYSYRSQLEHKLYWLWCLYVNFVAFKTFATSDPTKGNQLAS